MGAWPHPELCLCTTYYLVHHQRLACGQLQAWTLSCLEGLCCFCGCTVREGGWRRLCWSLLHSQLWQAPDRRLWSCAGLVPGLVCLVATPLILYVIYPPEQKDTPDAPEKARCGF